MDGLKRFQTYKVLSASYMGRLLEVFNITNVKSKKLLDVGCGRGEFTILSSLKGAQAVGLDASVKDVCAAKRKSKSFSSGNINFVVGDACSLPFKDGVFDRCLCIEVLEYISDDMKAVNEMRRVSETDAEIILAVPNANYPFIRDPIGYINPKYALTLKSWGHTIRLYDERSVFDLLKKNRFKKIKVRYVGHTITALIFPNYFMSIVVKYFLPDSIRSDYMDSQKLKKNESQDQTRTFSVICDFLLRKAVIVIEFICKLDKMLFSGSSKSISIILKCEKK